MSCMQRPNLTVLVEDPGVATRSHLRRRALTHIVATFAALFVIPVAQSQAQYLPTPGPTPVAPPPAPPIQYRQLPLTNPSPIHPLGLTPYSIGQPTDEE